MTRTFKSAAALLMLIFPPALASAQIDFPKNGYYVGMGDSVG